jgi:hypothetical protein
MAARRTPKKRRPSEDDPAPVIAHFSTREEAKAHAPKGFDAVRLERGWAAVRGWSEFLDTEGEILGSTHAPRLHGGGYLPGTPKAILAMRAARDEVEAALRERRPLDVSIILAARASADGFDRTELDMWIEEFKQKGGAMTPAASKEYDSHTSTISVARCNDHWKKVVDKHDAEWRAHVAKHQAREDALVRNYEDLKAGHLAYKSSVDDLMEQCKRSMSKPRAASAPATSVVVSPSPSASEPRGLFGKLFGR